MNPRTFALLALLTLCIGSTPPPAVAEQPNIILIMSDDIGLGGFSCYGADKYKTPHLDALARSGARFEHCWSMALCGPSRACLMTGRYAFRTGMVANNTGQKVSPEREVGIARVLKEAGYATAFGGKWNQLAYLRSAEDARRWGWDEYLMWDSSDSPGRYWKPRYHKNGKLVEGIEERYGPDLIHDYAVDFISRHKDRPFFFYYPMVLVHGPILRTPDSAAGSKNLRNDMVVYMDKLVGKLVEELGRQKLLEKTVILFTSDNGTPGADTIGGKELHGRKGTLTEGGGRVPLIVSWKGKVTAGTVQKDLVDFSDFFPTLVDLAEAKLPQGVTLDGVSFAPQLLDRRAALPAGRPRTQREWVYGHLQDRRYVRDLRWKLYSDGTLCDMKAAPFAETVLARGAEDDAAKEARARLQKVLDQLK